MIDSLTHLDLFTIARPAMLLDLCPWEKPILLAAATSKIHDLQQELEKGEHVDTRDSEFGRTALHWAVLSGHDGVVKLLLAHDADMNAVEFLSREVITRRRRRWTQHHYGMAD